MIPDLGAYAAEVLSSYAVSLVLLIGTAVWYWYRARQVRARLDQIEARQEQME